MNNQTVAVIGGGNGAFAAAAHLTLSGLQVNLCDPYQNGESLELLKTDRKLHYSGMLGSGTVLLNKVTTSLASALEDAGLVMLCVPTSTHAVFAQLLAPLLGRLAIVLLNPGHTGGALNFSHALSEAGFSGDLVLGETNTLTYIARKSGPDTINISNLAQNIYISSLPGKNIDRLLAETRRCYPHLQPCPTVIGTSLRNLNSMLHPPAMILGALWIEKNGGNWDFYYDGATPAVENLMQSMDDERLSIARAWGVPVEPLIDTLAMIGTTTQTAADTRSLRIALLESKPNRHIKAPKSLDDRYMHEDIGFGLVPMTELSRLAGVETPVLNSLITIASVINGIDYRSKGLNTTRLGLAGKSLDQIMEYFEYGDSQENR